MMTTRMLMMRKMEMRVTMMTMMSGRESKGEDSANNKKGDDNELPTTLFGKNTSGVQTSLESGSC